MTHKRQRRKKAALLQHYRTTPHEDKITYLPTDTFKMVAGFLTPKDMAKVACTSTHISNLAEATPEHKLGQLNLRSKNLKRKLDTCETTYAKTHLHRFYDNSFNALESLAPDTCANLLYFVAETCTQPYFKYLQHKQNAAIQSIESELKDLELEIENTEKRVAPQNRRR